MLWRFQRLLRKVQMLSLNPRCNMNFAGRGKEPGLLLLFSPFPQTWRLARLSNFGFTFTHKWKIRMITHNVRFCLIPWGEVHTLCNMTQTGAESNNVDQLAPAVIMCSAHFLCIERWGGFVLHQKSFKGWSGSASPDMGETQLSVILSLCVAPKHTESSVIELGEDALAHLCLCCCMHSLNSDSLLQ